MQAIKLSFVQQLLGRSPNSGNASDHGFNTGCPISRAPFAREVGKAPVHIWQRRFYDFNVWTEHKRIEKLRYIHRNPVARGLATEPEQWDWSSFRAYAFGEIGPVRINEWQILKRRFGQDDYCERTRPLGSRSIVQSDTRPVTMLSSP